MAPTPEKKTRALIIITTTPWLTFSKDYYNIKFVLKKRLTVELHLCCVSFNPCDLSRPFKQQLSEDNL